MNDHIIDLLIALSEDTVAIIELEDGTELQIEVPRVRFGVSGGKHSERSTETDLDYAGNLLCMNAIEEIR